MKAASSCQISLIWTYSQNQLFDSGVDFHKGSLQISARWNPLFLQIFLKFCHIHSVEIGSNFVFCHYELLLFLNVELVPQKIAAKIATRYEIPCGIKACLRCTAICGHKFPINRGFIWQSTHFSPWKYLIRYITVSTQNKFDYFMLERFLLHSSHLLQR